MKFSLDLDGTCYYHTDFFREFMRVMQAAGHQVGILCGHREESKDRIVARLTELGFPAPDFVLGRTEKYMSLNGAIFKSDMIVEHNIDYHFDDLDYDNPETIRLFALRPEVKDKLIIVHGEKRA